MSPDTPNIYDNFFSATSKMWHGNVSVKPLGVSGDPIDSALSDDNYIVIGILLLTILSMYFIMHSAPFLEYKLSTLLRAPRESSAKLRESVYTKKYLNYFIFQAIALAGLLAYSLFAKLQHVDYSPGRYAVIGAYAGVFTLVLVISEAVRQLHRITYFDRTQRKLFHIERTFTLAIYGILLLPLSIAHIYRYIDALQTLYIALLLLIFVKILEFHKVIHIFFRKNTSILQFFLYLCTLEAIPLALLAGILVFTTNILKINI